MSLSHLDRWPSANKRPPPRGPGNSLNAHPREPCVINRCRSIKKVMHITKEALGRPQAPRNAPRRAGPGTESWRRALPGEAWVAEVGARTAAGARLVPPPSRRVLPAPSPSSRRLPLPPGGSALRSTSRPLSSVPGSRCPPRACPLPGPSLRLRARRSQSRLRGALDVAP